MNYIHPDSEYRIIPYFAQLKNKGYELVSRINNYKWYHLDGVYHRENAPAHTQPSGYEAYYLHGKLHRLDGPAVNDPGGGKINRYFHIRNVNFLESEYWNHSDVIIYNKLCWPCNIKFDNLLDLMNHFKENHKEHKIINYIYRLLLA